MRFFELALSILVSATLARAATIYQVTDLGTLGGAIASGTAINNSGQITGTSATAKGERHAFLDTPGVGMVDLGTLPGDASSSGVAINNLGQVTGGSSPTDGFTTRGFVYTPGSGMADLGTLGGVYTYGLGINDAGQVTGQSAPVGGPCFTPFCKSDPAHAFLYTPGAGMIDVGTLGGNVASGEDINNRGQVTGSSSLADGTFHAFLYTPGIGMADLGTLGSNYSSATALNDRGEVIGGSYDTGLVHRGFLYVAGQGMTALPFDRAVGINESGQIIGMTEGVSTTGFLYSGGTTVNLGSLNLAGINDVGQIVANDRDRNRAFLLTPIPEPAQVPEPTSAPLLLAALVGLGGNIFRRRLTSHIPR